MRVKKRKQGCRSAIWRIFMIPILIGLMAGFIVVAAISRLGQQVVVAESLPTPVSTPVQAGSTRVVILLLNDDEDDIAGVWQWWSDVPGNSGRTACVLSAETRIAPSGRSVGEMMRLAMAAGNDEWVAKNTQDFAGDCLLGQSSDVDLVLFVSRLGMVKLVDAVGGIQVEGRVMDGTQAWDHMAVTEVAPAEVQRRQQEVWIALKTAIKKVQWSECEPIVDSRDIFRSVPSDPNPCRRFVKLLRQTPPYIAVP